MRLHYLSPQQRMNENRRRVAEYEEKLTGRMEELLRERRHRLALLAGKLESYSPGKETQWRVCIRGGWEPSGTAEHPPDQEKRYRADPFAGWHTDGSSDRNSGSRRSKK